MNIFYHKLFEKSIRKIKAPSIRCEFFTYFLHKKRAAKQPGKTMKKSDWHRFCSHLPSRRVMNLICYYRNTPVKVFIGVRSKSE